MENNTQQMAVEASILALLQQVEPQFFETYSRELIGIITDGTADFMARNTQLENWFETHPGMIEFEDVLFDLLLVQYLSAEEHVENYFDSEEWSTIEQITLDKGTEMLNLFLYLSEAKESEVQISLDDFLNEFLLVGEDEFQDEYRIYEPFIIHPNLLEADLDSLKIVKEKVKEDTGLKPFFLPIILFFQSLEDLEDAEQLANGLGVFEKGMYYSLLAYKNT